MAKQVVTPQQQLDEVRALVALYQALTKAQMTKIRKVLPQIRQQLELDGLEIASVIRVPLGKQIMQLLWAARSGLHLLDMTVQVAGGSAKEVKQEIVKLIKLAQVVEVCTPAGVVYCTTEATHQDDELLDATAQVAMLRQLQQQIAFLKKSSKSKLGATVPRPLVRLSPLSLVSAHPINVKNASPLPSPQSAKSTDATDATDLLLQIVAALEGKRGPVRIPDLLPTFGVSIQLAHAALLSGARAGQFDLQPESGMARLSVEEAKWCPPGPGHTTLAWLMPRSPR
jgi:hypothetical protein